MDSSVLIACFGLLLNIGLLLVGGVWAVSKISAQASVLNATISHLDRTVESLKTTIATVDRRLDDHAHRLTVVETRMETTVAAVAAATAAAKRHEGET